MPAMRLEPPREPNLYRRPLAPAREPVASVAVHGASDAAGDGATASSGYRAGSGADGYPRRESRRPERRTADRTAGASDHRARGRTPGDIRSALQSV